MTTTNETETKECGNCGVENAADHTFCSHCNLTPEEAGAAPAQKATRSRAPAAKKTAAAAAKPAKKSAAKASGKK